LQKVNPPMLKIILKNLFQKAPTRMYPIEKREPFAATRGHVDNDIDQCIYCGICQKKCPAGAIAVDRAEKSWVIDPLRCVACNYCVEVCPKKCLSMEKNYITPMTCTWRK